jgi:hypothetical protein
MKQGDTVIYSQRHFEWLESAGKWPRSVNRRRMVGVVDGSLGATPEGVVWVKWQPGSWCPTYLAHFEDNLEVL